MGLATVPLGGGPTGLPPGHVPSASSGGGLELKAPAYGDLEPGDPVFVKSTGKLERCGQTRAAAITHQNGQTFHVACPGSAFDALCKVEPVVGGVRIDVHEYDRKNKVASSISRSITTVTINGYHTYTASDCSPVWDEVHERLIVFVLLNNGAAYRVGVFNIEIASDWLSITVHQETSTGYTAPGLRYLSRARINYNDPSGHRVVCAGEVTNSNPVIISSVVTSATSVAVPGISNETPSGYKPNTQNFIEWCSERGTAGEYALLTTSATGLVLSFSPNWNGPYSYEQFVINSNSTARGIQAAYDPDTEMMIIARASSNVTAGAGWFYTVVGEENSAGIGTSMRCYDHTVERIRSGKFVSILDQEGGPQFYGAYQYFEVARNAVLASETYGGFQYTNTSGNTGYFEILPFGDEDAILNVINYSFNFNPAYRSTLVSQMAVSGVCAEAVADGAEATALSAGSEYEGFTGLTPDREFTVGGIGNWTASTGYSYYTGGPSAVATAYALDATRFFPRVNKFEAALLAA